jgi:prepilin-type N-terminal cleavage/methylation domain-containing protein
MPLSSDTRATPWRSACPGPRERTPANAGQSPPRRQRAFTLIELLTVIAIVGVLSAIVIGVGRRATESGKIARAKAELAALSAALESYKRHFGDYPQIVSDSAPADTASGERLYAALNGQRGPLLGSSAFSQRQRVFVSTAAFTLADPVAAETATNLFLDPWGNPYRYCYTPGAAWKNPGFVLFSAGPDGDTTLPFPGDGIKSATYDSALNDSKPVNLDNIYANQ